METQDSGEAHSEIDPGGLETRDAIQHDYGSRPEGWFQWLFERIEPGKPPLALDLGSGTGSLWQANREDLPRGWRIVLADSEIEMLRQARTGDMPQVAGRAAMDAHDLPLAAGAFGAVLALGLLDLIPNRARVLEEAWRVLAPGGRLYASAGGQSHLKEFEELLRPFAEAETIGGVEDTFGLENGREQLLPWFEQVELRLFRDQLVFEEAGPVLAYIFSERRMREELRGERRAALERQVRERLAAEGRLNVTVEKGLFAATKVG